MKSNNSKIRADQLLVDRALAPSRTRAQSLIMAGVVFVGLDRVDKPGKLLSSSAAISVKGKDHPYVSRGGVKLKAALDHFKILPAGKVCLDVGASTGGFTDCLLKEGAKKVYAIDVGKGQLDVTLRSDPRVVVLEKINFRYFDAGLLNDPIDLAVVDVSFISLTKIIPKIKDVILSEAKNLSSVLGRSFGLCPQDDNRAYLIALIKPQFEVGPKFLKKGIVTDEGKREECVVQIKNFCAESGFQILGVIPSPIFGAEGNQEYLLGAERA
ncbi:MAG: TlyA family RNA methyltransferase [Deltaproteobacteria bacterium]|nr:TlyA family RNA methyltransferase [Deltaproteobacteria bacterium]